MFTYNIQLAGYDIDEIDEKGKISFSDFINVIEKFPWLEQLNTYNDIQKGCSATISLINTIDNKVLWISITGDIENYTYLIGYVYSKKVKGFLGLGKEKVKRWVDIYSIRDFTVIKNYVKIFFCNDYLALETQLSHNEKLQSLQAKK